MDTNESMDAQPRPERVLPKETWGDGPWQQEPDRLEWYDEATGYPCLLNRNMVCSGTWCGYVAVPPGHPAHGVGYDDAPVCNLLVHGGVTHTGLCSGAICHVPRPGEPDNVFWIGFDAAHCFDVMPATRARLRSVGHDKDPAVMAIDARMSKIERDLGFTGDVYRDMAYMQQECRALAAQLKALEA